MSMKHYKGTVHPVHAMNAEQRQTAADPWTKPTDLSHWPAFSSNETIHHRHHRLSCFHLYTFLFFLFFLSEPWAAASSSILLIRPVRDYQLGNGYSPIQSSSSLCFGIKTPQCSLWRMICHLSKNCRRGCSSYFSSYKITLADRDTDARRTALYERGPRRRLGPGRCIGWAVDPTRRHRGNHRRK